MSRKTEINSVVDLNKIFKYNMENTVKLDKLCSNERKQELRFKLQKYTKKNVGEPFKTGQKYYILDNKVPNCVNSIVCNQTFMKGQTHSSREGEPFMNNKCFSYDSQVNLGNKKVQLDTQVKNYNTYGKSDDFNVKVWNKGKYKY